MCRPSCCKPPGNDGAGIAAVAVIAGAAFAYAKIGHTVAEILHTITVVLTVLLLAAVAALAAILVTWATARIIGRRRQIRRQAMPLPVRQPVTRVQNVPGCLACGDSGTVIRAIGPSHDQVWPCPVCQPVRGTG
jgi:hypothetical protein